MSYPLILILAGVGFIILYALGRWLMDSGIIGRLIGTHPYCKKCGFDLTGKPDTSTRCAECGADLSTPENTVTGVRRRRWGTALVGLSLVLLSFLIAWQTVTWLTGIYGWKFRIPWPERFLVSDAMTDTSARMPALKDLSDRIFRGDVSDKALQKLALHALGCQTDITKGWSPDWRNIVHQAFLKGLISKEQWQQYCRDGIGFTTSVRTPVEVGDVLPVVIRTVTVRKDNLEYSAFYNGVAWNLNVEIDSKPLDREHRLDRDPQWINSAQFGIKLTDSDFFVGKHTLRVVGEVSAQARLNGRQDRITIPIDSTVVFDIVPKGRDLVVPYTGPEPVTSLKEWIHARVLPQDNPNESNALILSLYVRVPFPVPISYSVFLRRDGQEWHLGDFAGAKGFDAGNILFEPVPGPPPRPNPFEAGAYWSGYEGDELVFRPNPDVAKKTVDVTEYYNREIVIPVKDGF